MTEVKVCRECGSSIPESDLDKGTAQKIGSWKCASYMCAKCAYDDTPSNRGILCMISFLIPLVGVIAGIMMLSHREEEDRITGKQCLGWAFAGFLVGIIGCFVIALN